jgi:hypothetical protein
LTGLHLPIRKWNHCSLIVQYWDSGFSILGMMRGKETRLIRQISQTSQNLFSQIDPFVANGKEVRAFEIDREEIDVALGFEIADEPAEGSFADWAAAGLATQLVCVVLFQREDVFDNAQRTF